MMLALCEWYNKWYFFSLTSCFELDFSVGCQVTTKRNMFYSFWSHELSFFCGFWTTILHSMKYREHLNDYFISRNNNEKILKWIFLMNNLQMKKWSYFIAEIKFGRFYTNKNGECLNVILVYVGKWYLS